MTLLADFTPHKVDIRLQKNSHTPVTFTFSDTDLTGYTNPILKWVVNQGDTPTVFPMTVTDAVGGVMEITFTATEWAVIGDTSRALFQIEAVDPDTFRKILVNGALVFQWSM